MSYGKRFSQDLKTQTVNQPNLRCEEETIHQVSINVYKRRDTVLRAA